MPLDRRCRHSRAIFGVRNIRGYSACDPTPTANRSTDLSSRGLALSQIARRKQNLGALAGEDARNSLSDPFASARHDDGPA
jgi:hypothetical protein